LLVRHLARKRSGSILTTLEPARGGEGQGREGKKGKGGGKGGKERGGKEEKGKRERSSSVSVTNPSPHSTKRV